MATTATGNVINAGNNTGLYGQPQGVTQSIGSYSNSNVISFLPIYSGDMGALGNITLTGNVNGNVIVANAYNWPNGQSIINSQPYGNSNVAAWLPTNTNANILAPNLSVTGVANIGTVQTNNYLYANGQPFTPGTNYSNANVASYLQTNTGAIQASVYSGNYVGVSSVVASVSVVSPIVQGNAVTANSLLVNGSANIPTIYSYNTSGGIDLYAGNGNVTVHSNVVANSVYSANYFFSNGQPFTTYGNSNVASYLPVYGGNILANNISATSNVTSFALQTTGVGGDITGANNIIANAFLAAQASLSGNLTTGGILTNNYYYANGVPVSFSGGSNYSNANVASYLPTYPGNVGNITTAGYIFGNGAYLTGIQAGTNYSNANVAAYLPTDPTIINIQGTAANTNSNVANLTTSVVGVTSTVTSLTGSLANTNSNVANNKANITILQGNVTSLTGALANTNSNVANNTTAIASLTGNVYANSNVAAYLPIYNGPILANNLSVAGNAIILGNLSVAGNVTFTNSNVITTNDLYIELANNQSTQAGINGAGIVAGNGNIATWLYNSTVNAWTSNVNISAAGAITTYSISTTGVQGNITGANYVNANFFVGNGALLTGLPAGYSNTNVAAYLAANTDPTILKIETNQGNTNSNVANTNANVTTLTTSVSGITANVTSLTGSVANTNANVANTNATVTTLTTSVSGITANVATLQGQVTSLSGVVYTNANTASYLATATGTIRATDIIASNSITATTFIGNIQGNISGNIVVPGSTGWALYNNNGNAGADVGFQYTVANKSLSVTGNISTANYFVGNGAYLTGLPASYGNSNVEAYLPTSPTIVSINSNVSNTNANVANTNANVANTNANVTTNSSAIVSLTGSLANTNSNVANTNANVTTNTTAIASLTGNVYNNANVAAYLPTYSGNLTAGNLSVSGNITDVAGISAGGNITGANLRTAGGITATGSIITSASLLGTALSLSGQAQSLSVYTTNISAVGLITALGNVSAGNVRSLGNITATGNVLAGNVSVTGNVQGTYILGNGSQLTGLPATYSNANVATYLPTYSGDLGAVGNITATGNVNALNVTVGNTVTATTFIGNIQGNITGNIVVPGSTGWVLYNNAGNAGADVGLQYTSASQQLSVTGNIVTAGRFIGDGGLLSNVQINYSNANVAAYLPTYSGNLNNIVSVTATGNITGGNLRTTGSITATGNVYSGNIILSSTGNVYGSILAGNISVTGLTVATGTITAVAGVQAGNLATGGFASATGNVTGGNIRTVGLVTATGNIQGNVFIGNGAGLTNINAANIIGSYGNANVEAYLPTSPYIANITSNIANTNSNVANTNATVANNSGNITSLQGQVSSLSGVVYTNANAASYLATATGNIATGNLATGATQIAIGLNTHAFGVAAQANAIAIGGYAGYAGQGANAIAIGADAAVDTQGSGAVAIGYYAGASQQGQNAIAIGNQAGRSAQPANSIIINASGSALNGTNAGFYVAPVRLDATPGNMAYYNTTTNEMTYGPVPATYGNANVAAYLPTYTGNLAGNSLSLSGNAVIMGNLSVAGNVTFTNSNVITTNDLYLELANNQTTYAGINGAGLAAGQGNLTTWTYSSSANAWTTNVGVSAMGNLATGGTFTAVNESLGYTNYVTSAQVITLTSAATYYQHFSGTSTATLKLPDGTTVAAGTAYVIDNDSTGNITIQDSAGNPIALVTTGMAGYIYSLSNATATGGWAGYAYVPGAGPTGQVIWGTNGLDMGGGNITTTGNVVVGNVSVTGNISAGYVLGNGYYLTGIQAGTNYSNANVAAYLPTYSGNLTAGNLSLTGNTTFGANRIFGDFSANAIASNTRVWFQTNQASSTGLVVMPGAGWTPTSNTISTSFMRWYSSTDIANSSFAGFSVSQSTATLITGVNGTGNVLPLTISTSANLNLTSSNLLISANNISVSGNIYALNRTIQGGNLVASGTTTTTNLIVNSNSLNLGLNAGSVNQGLYSFAMGLNAGYSNQGVSAIALGFGSGQLNQGNTAIAIGAAAGNVSQGIGAIAIGYNAAVSNQGQYSIVIGAGAANSVPVANSSILLDASGQYNSTALNSGFYVLPVRSDSANVTNSLYYNTTTNEITQALAYGNTTVETYLPTSPYIGNISANISLISGTGSGNTTIVSANTATTIDTLNTATYRTAKYVIQATSGTSYQSTEALVISDGTTASVNEYGTVTTGSNLGAVSALQSGANVLVQFTATNAGTVVRLVKQTIAV